MKSFFKDILKKIAVTIISSFIFVLFSFFLFQAIVNTFVERPDVETAEGSFLVLDLSMNLTDRPSGLKFEDITREVLTNERKPPNFHLREVTESIAKAASDRKVRGICIQGGFKPDGYGCGYGAIKELVAALELFKESGKKILGFFSNPTQLDYLVYSICDELHMNSSGTLILKGLANEQLFFAETFKKYGVGVQVVRVGEFKGAVEPFTSTEFSQENRLQISRLLDLRWEDYLNSISKNRGIDKQNLISVLENGFLLTPSNCMETGLTDRVSTYGAFLERLLELGTKDDESEEFARIDLIDYVDRADSTLKVDDEDIDEEKDIIAVVYVEGVIVDGFIDDGFSVGGDEIAHRIRKLAKDENVKGLVLRINSPGGSVSGSEAILNELSRIKEKGVPVVISMGSVAASGGYWISMDSDKIFAGEQTITGSIGVFGLIPNMKKLAENFGLQWDVVKTHPSSDIMSVSRPKSEKELQIIQEYIDRIYERFLYLVGTNRDLNSTRVDKIAQGRVWMGVDALKHGLVDELGGLEDAIEYTISKTGVKEFEILEFPKVKNSLDILTETFKVESHLSMEASVYSGWGVAFEEIKYFIYQISHFNDPRDSYFLLPWYRGRFGF